MHILRPEWSSFDSCLIAKATPVFTPERCVVWYWEQCVGSWQLVTQQRIIPLVIGGTVRCTRWSVYGLHFIVAQFPAGCHTLYLHKGTKECIPDPSYVWSIRLLVVCIPLLKYPSHTAIILCNPFSILWSCDLTLGIHDFILWPHDSHIVITWPSYCVTWVLY